MALRYFSQCVKAFVRAWERGAPKKTAAAPTCSHPPPTNHPAPPGAPDQTTAEEDIAHRPLGGSKGVARERGRRAMGKPAIEPIDEDRKSVV